MQQLKTQKRLENERKWASIFDDFTRLYCGGAMKVPIYIRLGKKYGMHRNVICRIVCQERKRRMEGAA